MVARMPGRGESGSGGTAADAGANRRTGRTPELIDGCGFEVYEGRVILDGAAVEGPHLFGGWPVNTRAAWPAGARVKRPDGGRWLRSPRMAANLSARWLEARLLDGCPGHPLAPIVKAWWTERPREVAASKRADPILPGPVIMAPTGDRRAGTLYGLAAQRHPDNPTRWLPGFAPARESPALPLHLYDLGAGQQRGAGESYALRSFVWALLDTRPEDRNPDRPALLPPERLGDYVRRAYGLKHYRPARHGAAIACALDALESDEARVPFCRDGGWTARRVVSVADKPTRGASSDWIRLAVHLPPGSERGAIVDRERQKAAGLRSPTAFRLALSLAFAWAKPGALRQPVGKRGHWRQLRSAGRYPVLTDDRLMEWAYPAGATFRHALPRAAAALAHLERIGLVRRVEAGGAVRLVPGADWAGWGEE